MQNNPHIKLTDRIIQKWLIYSGTPYPTSACRSRLNLKDGHQLSIQNELYSDIDRNFDYRTMSMQILGQFSGFLQGSSIDEDLRSRWVEGHIWEGEREEGSSSVVSLQRASVFVLVRSTKKLLGPEECPNLRKEPSLLAQPLSDPFVLFRTCSFDASCWFFACACRSLCTSKVESRSKQRSSGEVTCVGAFYASRSLCRLRERGSWVNRDVTRADVANSVRLKVICVITIVRGRNHRKDLWRVKGLKRALADASAFSDQL